MQELEEASDETPVSQAGDRFVPLRARRGDGGGAPSLGGGGAGARQHGNKKHANPRGAPTDANDPPNLVGGSSSKKPKDRNDEKPGRRQNVEIHGEDRVDAGPSSARVESQERVGGNFTAVTVKKGMKAREGKRKVEAERQPKDEDEEEEEEDECARKPEREMQRLSKWLKVLVRQTAHRHVSLRLRQCLRNWLEVHLRGETLLPSSADGPDDVFEVTPEVISELLRRARRPVVPVMHTDTSITTSKSTAPPDDDLDEDSVGEDDEEHMYSRVMNLLQPIGTSQDVIEDRENLRELLHEFVDTQIHRRREAVKERRDFLHFLRARGRDFLAERLQPRAEELATRVHAAVTEEAIQRAGYSLGEDRRRLREWVRTCAQLVMEQRLSPTGVAGLPSAAGARSDEQAARKHSAVLSTAPVAPPQRRALREYLEQVVEREMRDETALREIQRKRLRVLLSMMKQQDLRSWLRSLEMELKGQRQDADAASRDQNPVRKSLRGGAHELEKWLKGSLYARVEMIIHERELENAKLQECQVDITGTEGTEISKYMQVQEQRNMLDDKELCTEETPENKNKFDEQVEKEEAAETVDKSRGEEGAILKENQQINPSDKHIEGQNVGDVTVHFIKEHELTSNDTDKCIECALLVGDRMEWPETYVNLNGEVIDIIKQMEIKMEDQGKELEKNRIIKMQEEKCTVEKPMVGDSGEVADIKREEKESVLSTATVSANASGKIKQCEEAERRFDETCQPNLIQMEKLRSCIIGEEELTIKSSEKTVTGNQLEDKKSAIDKLSVTQVSNKNTNIQDVLQSKSSVVVEKTSAKTKTEILLSNNEGKYLFNARESEQFQIPTKTKPSEALKDSQRSESNTYEIINYILQQMIHNIIEVCETQQRRKTSSITEDIINDIVGNVEESEKQESLAIIENILQEIIGKAGEKIEKQKSTSIIQNILQEMVENVIEKYNIQVLLQETSSMIQDIVHELVANVIEENTEADEKSTIIKGIVEDIIGNVIQKSEGRIRKKETLSIITDILKETVENVTKTANRQETSIIIGTTQEIIGNVMKKIERLTPRQESSVVLGFSQTEGNKLKNLEPQESSAVIASVAGDLITNVIDKIERQRNDKETNTIVSYIIQELLTNVLQNIEKQRNRQETIALIEDVGQEILGNVFQKLEGQTIKQETIAIIESMVEEMICNIKEKTQTLREQHGTSKIIQNIMIEMIGNVSEMFEGKNSRIISTTSIKDMEEEMVGSDNEQYEKLMGGSMIDVTHTIIEGVVEQMVGNAIKVFDRQETTKIIEGIMQEMLKNVIDKSGRSTAAMIETIMQETMKKVYEKIENAACSNTNEIAKTEIEKGNEPLLQVVSINEEIRAEIENISMMKENEISKRANETQEMQTVVGDEHSGSSSPHLQRSEFGEEEENYQTLGGEEQDEIATSEEILYSKRIKSSTDTNITSNRESERRHEYNEIKKVEKERSNEEEKEEMESSRRMHKHEKDSFTSTYTSEETSILLSNIADLRNKSNIKTAKVEKMVHFEEEDKNSDKTNNKKCKLSVEYETDSGSSERKKGSSFCIHASLTRKKSIHVIKQAAETNAENGIQNEDNSGRDEHLFSETESMTYESEYDSLETGRSITEIRGQDMTNRITKGTESECVESQEQEERSRRLREQEEEIMAKLYKAWAHDAVTIKNLAETRDDFTRGKASHVNEMVSEGLETGDRHDHENDYCLWPGAVDEAVNEERERQGGATSEEDDIGANSRQFLHEEIDVELFEQYQADDEARHEQLPVTAVTCPGVHSEGEDIHEDATEMRDWLEEYIHTTVAARMEAVPGYESQVHVAGARTERQFLPERHGAFIDCSRRGGRVHGPDGPDAHSTTCVCGSDVALWSLDEGEDQAAAPGAPAFSGAVLGETASTGTATPGAVGGGGGEAPTGEELLLQRFLQDAAARAGESESRATLLGSLRRFVVETVERVMQTRRSSGSSSSSSASDLEAARSARRLSRTWSLGRCSDPSRERLCATLKDQAKSDLREWLSFCVEQRLDERLGASGTSDATATNALLCDASGSAADRERVSVVQLATFECTSNMSLEDSSHTSRAAIEEDQDNVLQETKSPATVSDNTSYSCTPSARTDDVPDSARSFAPYYYSIDKSPATVHGLESSNLDSTLTSESSPVPSIGQEQDVLDVYERNCSPRNVLETLLCAYRDLLSQRLSELLGTIGHNTMSPRESLVSARGDALPMQDVPEERLRGHGTLPCGASADFILPINEAEPEPRARSPARASASLSPSPPGSPHSDASRQPPPRRFEGALPFTCEGNFGDEEFKKEQELLHMDLSLERRREHGDAEATDSPPEPPGPPSEKSTESLLEPRGAASFGPLGVIPRSPSLIGSSLVASDSTFWDASTPREVTAFSTRRHGSGRARTSSAVRAARSALESMISAAVNKDDRAVCTTQDPVQPCGSNSSSENESQFPRGRNILGQEHLSFTLCRVLSTVGSVISASAGKHSTDLTVSQSTYSATTNMYTMELPEEIVTLSMGKLPSATSRTPSTVGSVVSGCPFSTPNSTSPVANAVINPSDANAEQRVSSLTDFTPLSLHDLLEASRLSAQPFHLHSLSVASDENELRAADEDEATTQESPGQEEYSPEEPITLDIRVSWVTMHHPYDGHDSSDDIHASCGFHDSDVCMLERLSYMHSEDCDDNTHLYNLFDDKQVQVLDFNVDEDSSTVSERGVIHWSSMDEQMPSAEESLRNANDCVLALPALRSSEESEDEDVTDLPITVATSSVDDLMPTRIREGSIVVDDFSSIMIPGMQGYWFGENGRLSAQIQGNSSPLPLHDIVDDVTKPERPISGESSCMSGQIQCVSGCGCPGDMDSISEWSRTESHDDIAYSIAPTDVPVNVPIALSSLAANAASRTPTDSDTPESPTSDVPTPATTAPEPAQITHASTSEGRNQQIIDPQDEEMHLAMALRQQEQHDSTRLRAPVTTAASRAARVRPEAQPLLQAQNGPLCARSPLPDVPSKSWDSEQFDVESKAESDEEDEEDKDFIECNNSKEKVTLADENGRVTSNERAESSECVIAAAHVQSFHELHITVPLTKNDDTKKAESLAEEGYSRAPEVGKNASGTTYLESSSFENLRGSVPYEDPHSNTESFGSQSTNANKQSNVNETITNYNERPVTEQLKGEDEETPEFRKEMSQLDEIAQDDRPPCDNLENSEVTSNLYEDDLDLVTIHEYLVMTPCRVPQDQPPSHESYDSADEQSQRTLRDQESMEGQQDSFANLNSTEAEPEPISDNRSTLEEMKRNENSYNGNQTYFFTCMNVNTSSTDELFSAEDSKTGRRVDSPKETDEIVKDSKIKTLHLLPSPEGHASDDVADVLDISPNALSKENLAKISLEMEQCDPAIPECEKDGQSNEERTILDSGKYSSHHSGDKVETVSIEQFSATITGTEGRVEENRAMSQASASNATDVTGGANVSDHMKAETKSDNVGQNVTFHEDIKLAEYSVRCFRQDIKTENVTSNNEENSEGKVIIHNSDNATGTSEGAGIQYDARATSAGQEEIIENSSIDMKGKDGSRRAQIKTISEQKKEECIGRDEELVLVSELVSSISAHGEISESVWNDLVTVNPVNEVSTLSVYRTASNKVVNNVEEVKIALERIAKHDAENDEIGSPSYWSQEEFVSKERESNESLTHHDAALSPVAGPSGYVHSPVAGVYAHRPSASDSSSGEDEAVGGAAARERERAQEAAAGCHFRDDSAQCAEVCGERYTESFVRHFTCAPRPAERLPRLRLGPLPDEDAEDENGAAGRAWTDDEFDDALRPAYLPPKPISALVSETDSDMEDVSSIASAPPGAHLSRLRSAEHPHSDLSGDDSRRPSCTDTFRPTSAAISDPGPWFPPDLEADSTRDAVSSTLMRKGALAKDKTKKDDKKKLGMKARVRSFFASAFGLNKKNPPTT